MGHETVCSGSQKPSHAVVKTACLTTAHFRVLEKSATSSNYATKFQCFKTFANLTRNSFSYYMNFFFGCSYITVIITDIS